MSVFDYPTLDDNILRVAPQITPSGAGWTRVCNIVDYGSVKGGYGRGLDQLLATADELFLDNQAPLSTWHGLYPLLTMAQHSCCPNSVTSYVGESAMLRATQDLAAGDQVTISHMASLSVPVTDRQQRLQEKCACPRCTVEEKLPRRIQTKIQAVQAQGLGGTTGLTQLGRQKQGTAGQKLGLSQRSKVNERLDIRPNAKPREPSSC